MKQKLQLDSDRGVSPVIGVVLMVAVTVILAAIIAAFVMDIGPGSEPVQAGVDVDAQEIMITNTENVDTITYGCDSADPDDETISDPSVGQSVPHGCSDTVTVVGLTDAGGEMVLYDDDV